MKLDNQQIRLSEETRYIASIAWLAGMIDADGCIHFAKRDRRGYTSYSPLVDIATNNERTINILVDLFEKIGVSVYVVRAKQRTCVSIRVQGINKCLPVLKEVMPFMVTKQREAELALLWCESRHGKKLGGRSVKGRQKFLKSTLGAYTDTEKHLIAEVKRMKTDRNLRDYMPTPCWLEQGEDIVRTCTGVQEASRNDLPTMQKVA